MKKEWPILLLALLTPSRAYADLVWPALSSETKVSSFPIIALSLVIEFFVIRYLFDIGSKKSIQYTVASNLASSILGLVLRPLSGMVWEFSLGGMANTLFGWGTFNPVAWTFVPIVGGAVNSAIELLTIKLMWKEAFTKNRFLVLWAVNWLTIGIATIWVIVSPPQL